MEVAGLVLGAIPIALYALDNYTRCLQATKDVIKYEATITTLRHHVFIQKKQLEVTLHNTGLHIVNGRLPTKAQLKEHLSNMYSAGDCGEFMGIIYEMEKTMAQLLHKLDLDSQGKPRWSNGGTPERVSWEWRRVRRGLGSSTRNDLVQQLQYWNTALSKVFEKHEIPQDEDGLLVQKLQLQFDAKTCNKIRSNLQHIYGAVSHSWKCSCAKHQGNLLLTWHKDIKAHLTTQPAFTLSSPSPTREWVLLTAQVEQEKDDALDPAINPAPMPTITDTSKRKRARLAFSKQNPIKVIKSLVAAVTTNTATTVSASPAVTLPPVPIPPLPRISCICDFIDPCSRERKARIPFSNPYTDVTKELILSCSPLPPLRNPGQYRPLSRLLGVSTAEPRHLSSHILAVQYQRDTVSRKDRFAIAAAATWAVLYLCGTPWLEDWMGLSTIVMGTQTKEPAISCALKPPFQSSRASTSKQPVPPSDGVRNGVLFTLGVVLTELCLNTTLGELRSQTKEELSDFELADRVSDLIYLDAGQSYGYAVQRCLRCEFPGRDTTKSLEFEQFRKVFFDGVVAPVQAAFLLQCN
ncbi:hypothetical protein B0T25DRAFT_361481 [Lasiosphaeria hispida]|uniref:Uncharacterized protein n=1 Tax=Lasiosphaeria hispida TaxID=260671 RepID=A0AAJ0H5I1_9PEZI|nr:hypothetical protein B0T25DRAFT_361481 [Lasiosphaeria hispida]